ncbi:hypothetical protein BU24DRAFT_428016 [Aaosphaeria arxii CBS 175.79]|uniref:Uncharacterized protein n=1 Tax=Aaosphaeria arxii CBS 175.79 TaxID=1450172 RepID=A0A6A5XA92_9PLEO|nr:uncharacterized protein BU24DRAFT_428016 [Aaosphaeria arxii CBS 175.79]KAF2009975.1 hypothetical protein BU24DRAFT_428016 [Aaosphaeria arxii CBS 175.79]
MILPKRFSRWDNLISSNPAVAPSESAAQLGHTPSRLTAGRQQQQTKQKQHDRIPSQN